MWMNPLMEERLKRYIKILRSKVVEMGIRAEQAVESSLRALNEGNRRLAYSIILHDQRIDELEMELDRLCLEFLARQQPIAGHLRFAFATIKINTALERVGDYAESIARQVLFIPSGEAIPLKPRFIELGELATKMLHDAIQAFVDENVELARSTMLLEDQTDEIRRTIRQELLELHREEEISMELVAACLICSGRFERVADQAANICEEVLYMCTGEVVKHRYADIYRVLFVSRNNSVRSQMAEGIANSLGLEQFVFSSAGLTPRRISPQVVGFMSRKGIDIGAQNSKSMEQIPNLEHYQVIVLLDRDLLRELRPMPAKAITLHWFMPELFAAESPAEEINAAFENAYNYLHSNINDFVQAVQSDVLFG